MPARELVEQGIRRREQIMAFIVQFWAEHGYSPSIAEIGEGVGIVSPNAVRSHLQKLISEDRIKMDPGIARSIRLV